MRRVSRLVAGDLAFDDFNFLLHHLRGLELSRMPRGARVMLSAGCGGPWYFDWIEERYGQLERHVGVELYSPRPDGLPMNVEWVNASVGNMPQVGDASIDLLFSGQNLEHLFGDDAVRFLLEASRVLRPGGSLVMDSPNREMTNLLLWCHPEHTIEYAADEARDLVALAGFDVTSLRGIWLVRDPRTKHLLPLDPYSSLALPFAIRGRIRRAEDDPENSFVWWLEAVRTERPADREGLYRRQAEIFAAAWPERLNRFWNPAGVVSTDGGTRVVTAAKGVSGCLMAGPMAPLAPASYEVTFTLRRFGAQAVPRAVVALVEAIGAMDGSQVFARHELTSSDLPLNHWTDVSLAFRVDELSWAGQFRVVATGLIGLQARMEVRVRDEHSPVWPSSLRMAGADATV